MTPIEEIIAALMLCGSDDLRVIRAYIRWIKFRRKVNDRFYPVHHWVRSSRRYHWVGK